MPRFYSIRLKVRESNLKRPKVTLQPSPGKPVGVLFSGQFLYVVAISKCYFLDNSSIKLFVNQTNLKEKYNSYVERVKIKGRRTPA